MLDKKKKKKMNYKISWVRWALSKRTAITNSLDGETDNAAQSAKLLFKAILLMIFYR